MSRSYRKLLVSRRHIHKVILNFICISASRLRGTENVLCHFAKGLQLFHNYSLNFY